MQKNTELVGYEPVTRGAVGLEMGLVFFDKPFHAPAGAVELFVDESR